MFDSGSDCDLNTSVNASNMDSATDAQLLAETCGEQLQEEIASLTKQNNILRAQFEQAVALTEKMEDVHKENEQLKQQIRELNNQKQDLVRRLEISTLAQNEAAKKITEERQSMNAQRESDVAIIQKEMEKTKKSFQAQNDSLYDQLQASQSANEQLQIAQKTLQGRIEKMLENASHYLNKDFQSFDDLASFFEKQASQGFIVQEPQETAKNMPLLFGQPSDDRSQEYERKIKSIKQQLKAEIATNKELVHKLDLASKNSDRVEAQHKNEINNLNTKTAQLNEEHAQIVRDLKRKISQLETKLAAAQTKPAPKKEAIKPIVAAQTQPVQAPAPVIAPRIIVQPQQPVEQARPSIKPADQEIINDQYIARINELNKQLDEVNGKLKASTEQNKISETRIGELTVALDKAEREHAALKTVHQETINEVESIRRALHAKEEARDKKAELQRRRDQQKAKATIMNLEKNAETLKGQIFEQQLESEKQNHLNNELKAKIAVLESENNELRSNSSKLQAEITDLTQKAAMKKELTEEDVLPSTSFSTSKFEPSIVQQIDKVAMNGSLSAASKLQHIYHIISKAYNQKLQELTRELDESASGAEKIETIFSDFIVNLSIALTDNAITLEDFINNKLSQNLVQVASGIRSHAADEHRHAEYLQAIVDTFTQTFGSGADVTAQINAVRGEIEQKQNEIEARKKKSKALKTQLSDALTKLQNIKSERDETENQLKDEVARLTTQNDQLTETNRKMKAELKDAKDRLIEKEDLLEQAQHNIEEREANIEEEREAYEQSIQQQHEELETKLANDLQQQQETNAALEQQLAKFKQAVAIQNQTISERENKIAQLQKDSDIFEKSITARAELEKKQIVESYEKAIAEITAQCNAHRSDVERLSGELAKSEKKVRDAKQIVLKTKRDNAKAEKELKSMEEQFNREKKLHESALKNAQITAEANFTQKINEVKSKAEDERRKLFAVAATEFNMFFNATEQIDERSYKNIIQKAKSELERLSKSDSAIRRMVGAGSKQSTDDAVAQLMMEH